MLTTFLKLIPGAACMTMILLLTSCGGSAKTSYYLLTPADKPPESTHRIQTADAVAIEIASIILPSHLDRQHIVVHTSDNEIEPSLLHQWGGRLDRNIANVIAVNLTRLLGNASISMPPHKTPVHPDYRLEIEIFRFERLSNYSVQLTARWKLLDGSGETTLVNRMDDFSAEKTPQEDLGHTVASMSRLIDILSQKIAEAVTEQLQNKEETDA